MAEVQDFRQQVQCIPEMYIWEVVTLQHYKVEQLPLSNNSV
jgi:hypothetical protein